MLLKELELENIRSFTKEKISFPEGTTLFSGDIGSGKTTILLAIEFALFGVQKGNTSGFDLLRHGSSQGRVRLTFSLEDKEVIIERSLKRTNSSISQDRALLIVNGKAEELLAKEVKARVLALLNYPADLLTKTKSLVFRYTVFCPQDEINSILLGPAEERLEIIRKIFHFDKYKIIKENAQNYAKHLRERKNILEAKLEEVVRIEKHLKSREELLAQNEEKHATLLQTFAQQNTSLEEIEQREVALQKELLKAKEKEGIRTRIEDLNEQIEANNKRILLLGKEVEIPALPEKPHHEEKLLREKEQQAKENIIKIRSSMESAKTLLLRAQEIAKKISSLSSCPFCLQEVSDNHKNHISDHQQEIINQEKTNIEQFEEKLQKVQNAQNQISTMISEWEKFHKAEEQQRFAQALEKKNTEHKSSLEEANTLLLEKISALKKLITSQQDKENDKRIQNSYDTLLKEKRHAQESLQKTQNQITSITTEQKLFAREIQEGMKRKEELAKEKKEKDRVIILEEWMKTKFVNLVSTMEKKLLASIYYEFNDHFSKWFQTLIENELFSIRLDESFTPIIEQNGYETTFANLSGGEKTSVSLAYRLALNRVVNNFLAHIKTRDLIILDEPTTGFSTEQLDRLLEVLEELGTTQKIVVSHEAKLESHADHVITVEKYNHESKVSI
ncbi:MAG: AAA family ATPase [Candidatus Woesearchaeota archaeon]|nr:MAG: AAA family ATPase [Candidatus Woesearchaeota archaeon]